MVHTPFTSLDGEPSTQGVDEKNVENDENKQPNNGNKKTNRE